MDATVTDPNDLKTLPLHISDRLKSLQSNATSAPYERAECSIYQDWAVERINAIAALLKLVLCSPPSNILRGSETIAVPPPTLRAEPKIEAIAIPPPILRTEPNSEAISALPPIRHEESRIQAIKVLPPILQGASENKTNTVLPARNTTLSAPDAPDNDVHLAREEYGGEADIGWYYRRQAAFKFAKVEIERAHIHAPRSLAGTATGDDSHVCIDCGSPFKLNKFIQGKLESGIYHMTKRCAGCRRERRRLFVGAVGHSTQQFMTPRSPGTGLREICGLWHGFALLHRERWTQIMEGTLVLGRQRHAHPTKQTFRHAAVMQRRRQPATEWLTSEKESQPAAWPVGRCQGRYQEESVRR